MVSVRGPAFFGNLTYFIGVVGHKIFLATATDVL